MTVKVKANANIALVKYWGKREPKLNLPAVGSISATLDNLNTETEISIATSGNDEIIYNGKPANEKEYGRISNFLNSFRKEFGVKDFFSINTINNFPSGAGLASSASGFAALAAGVNKISNTRISDRELSILARKGSGSAARSIFGGFVEMKTGEGVDSHTDYAEQIAPANHWDLSVVILVTSGKQKKISSTDGMNATAYSSPYYNSWISSSKFDLYEAKKAIKQKDFEKLADVTEFSTLKMHGLAMAARPGIIYWNGTTLDLINEVKDMRTAGSPVFFTIDAGPQLKIFTPSENVTKIKDHFSDRNGIETIIVSGIGDGVKIVE
ncbi:MAG: diphosphomevalonate decarboxylase [Melioribacteraceae bacterium]|nr:MAG: diphosphomevalonate decarboxylase [Melioribacteraceae bacterium]